MPGDLARGHLLALELAPAPVETELGPPDERPSLGLVEGEEDRVEPEASRDGRDDRLEDGVRRRWRFSSLEISRIWFEGLRPLPVSLGELLDLRADRVVLEDEGDLLGNGRERGHGRRCAAREKSSREPGDAGLRARRSSQPDDHLVGRLRREPDAPAAPNARRAGSSLDPAPIRPGGGTHPVRDLSAARRDRPRRWTAISRAGSSSHSTSAMASIGTSFCSAAKTLSYRSPRPPTAKMFEISRMTSRSLVLPGDAVKLSLHRGQVAHDEGGEHDRKKASSSPAIPNRPYTRISRATIGESSSRAMSWKRPISSSCRARRGGRARGTRRRAPC